MCFSIRNIKKMLYNLNCTNNKLNYEIIVGVSNRDFVISLKKILMIKNAIDFFDFFNYFCQN